MESCQVSGPELQNRTSEPVLLSPLGRSGQCRRLPGCRLGWMKTQPYSVPAATVRGTCAAPSSRILEMPRWEGALRASWSSTTRCSGFQTCENGIGPSYSKQTPTEDLLSLPSKQGSRSSSSELSRNLAGYCRVPSPFLGGECGAPQPASERRPRPPALPPQRPQGTAALGPPEPEALDSRTMATVFELPDLVLLEIFSYLPVRDRIRISRVCHRWKRLVDDRWLWRHVDLTLYTMRPKVMWHLLRRYMASRLHSLRMGGYLFSGSQAPQLSPALMRALGQKCPNLRRLCLHVADLSTVPITSLPCTLRTLELHSCEISMAWLLKEQDPTVLPLLECIVLDRVPAFRDEHLQGLTRFRALRSLVLGGTYRVTETGLDASLQELSYLQRLEVLGCTLSADSTLLAISRHLRKVRKVRLTVGGLSAQGLVFLEGMPALESLCLQGPLITPDMPTPAQIVKSCLTMPKLRVLEVQGLGWEGQEAEKVLCRGLAHCMVIVRACPKESMDWWM